MNAFIAYENVKIKKSGDVRPWIIASDAVIHNGCTTGISSVVLDKPTFAYMPKGINLLSTPNEVSISCESSEELINKIKNNINDERKNAVNKKQESIIRKYIGNTEFDSAQRISDIICTIDNQRSGTRDQNRTYPSTPIKHKMKRYIVNIVGSDLFGPLYFGYLRAGGDHKFKFSKTTKEEIVSTVSEFPNSIIPNGLKIEQIPGIVYGFKLYS
jgi:hypothetical protein